MYITNGNFRKYIIENTPIVFGIPQTGETTTYSLLSGFTYNNINYPILTQTELARLSDNNYIDRKNAFINYLSITLPVFSSANLLSGFTGTSLFCLSTTTTTTTTTIEPTTTTVEPTTTTTTSTTTTTLEPLIISGFTFGGVGSIGRIYSTINNGNNWINLDLSGLSGETRQMRDGIALNPNNIILVGLNGLIMKTEDNGVSWSETVPTSSISVLNTITKTPNNTIFVGGTINNGLYKSTDSGNTWSTITTNHGSSSISDIQFISDNIGYFTTAGSGSAIRSIYKTIDGGDNWISISGNTSFPISLLTVHFINENVGFLGGSGFNNLLYKTIDGGDNWILKSINGLNSDFDVADILFYDDNLGFASGNALLSGLTIYKTIDGGETWNIVYNNTIFGSRIEKIGFFNENHWYFCGPGFIVYTTNQGSTFVQQQVVNPSVSNFRLYGLLIF